MRPPMTPETLRDSRPAGPPQRCLADPQVRVVEVEGRQVHKWPPHPLSTLELQKRGTSALRLPGERIMRLAEELYQGGYVSYPRTETDRFSPNTDLASLIQGLAAFPGDEGVAGFANRLLDANAGLFRWPPGGNHDDQAHPPIHPTKSPTAEEWAGWQVPHLATPAQHAVSLTPRAPCLGAPPCHPRRAGTPV